MLTNPIHSESGSTDKNLERLVDEEALNSFSNSRNASVTRWIVLVIFIFSEVANALLLLTWSPITNKANQYFDGIGITAINLLNVVFQIMYFPGTLIALVMTQYLDLRSLLILGGTLNTLGCIIRFIGAAAKGYELSSEGAYTIILFGTILNGLAQPFYLNLPARIATTWFTVNERDIATTLCFLAHPLGTSIGSLISPTIVNGNSDDGIASGIFYLLLTQLIVSFVIFSLLLTFFKAKPDIAPSQSAKEFQRKESMQSTKTLLLDVCKLFSNMEYIKLFFSFTLALGSLNAIVALLNQLPGGYSNTDIGYTGAVVVMSGFFGSLAVGGIIEYTKRYRLILKSVYPLAFAAWIFFLSNCKGNNFGLFIFSGACLGFATLPFIPSTIVSAVECAYPVQEDLTVGFLYIGGNLMAIGMTFIGQTLLMMKSDVVAPFFPYGIWSICIMFCSNIPIVLFRGEDLRYQSDK